MHFLQKEGPRQRNGHIFLNMLGPEAIIPQLEEILNCRFLHDEGSKMWCAEYRSLGRAHLAFIGRSFDGSVLVVVTPHPHSWGQ